MIGRMLYDAEPTAVFSENCRNGQYGKSRKSASHFPAQFERLHLQPGKRAESLPVSSKRTQFRAFRRRRAASGACGSHFSGFTGRAATYAVALRQSGYPDPHRLHFTGFMGTPAADGPRVPVQAGKQKNESRIHHGQHSSSDCKAAGWVLRFSHLLGFRRGRSVSDRVDCGALCAALSA